jgi:hypothetical protein
LKIPSLLAEYLLQKRELTLQGIGRFTLDQVYENPFEKDKSKQELPEGSVHFIADKKAKEDITLIEFISKNTGKIKPLAASDLDSFIVLGQQLLNISKPFVIEGIGTLQMDGHNEIEFLQGHVHLHKKEESLTRKNKVAATEENGAVSFEDNYLKPAKKPEPAGRRAVIMGLILLGLGVMAWVGYYFYSNSKQKVETGKEPPVELNMNPAKNDTTSVKTDSVATPVTSVPQGSTASVIPQGNFRIVLEIANRKRALKRYADLREWGHTIIMTTTDSVKFKIAIPIHAPLKDSSRHRDSLSRYFARKVWIEI